MIRAHTRSAAMVRAIARSRSQPLAARPSPRRTMREKLSITSKPSACGLATSNLQLLVPRSSAASGRGVRPGSADPVMVGVGAMGQADRLSLPTAARQGLPSALAESEALGLGVPTTAAGNQDVATSSEAIVAQKARLAARLRPA